MKNKENPQTVYIVSITNYFKPQNVILSHFYLTFSFPPLKEHIVNELEKMENSYSGELIKQIKNFVNELMDANPVTNSEMEFGGWSINRNCKEIERIECYPCEVVTPISSVPLILN